MSRPTPSHLFAQRHGEAPDDDVAAADNGGERPVRPTRVIPGLARVPDAASPPPEPEPEPEPTPIAPPDPAPPTLEPPAAPKGAPATPEPPVNDVAAGYPADLVFIVRSDGKVLFVNRPLGRCDEEDVIGSDILDWIFPEQHDVVRESLLRVFQSGVADGHQLNGIHQHDAHAWYECRVSPNLRDGSVVSATIIARDVTRFRRAEMELREEHAETKRLLAERTADLAALKAERSASHEAGDGDRADHARFRSLLDAAGEAIFVTDAETGEIVDMNETASRWLRQPREQLLGRPAQALGLGFQITPPEDFDLQFTETRDSRRPLILDGGIHRRSDGSTFPVEVAVAHHSVGKQDLVLAVVRDAKGKRWAEEELREAEARFRALFEQTGDAIYVTTRAGKIEDANPAAVGLFGYLRDDFIGLDARELLPRPADIRGFQGQMAERGAVDQLDVHLRLASGQTVPGVVSASCLRDADGGLRGYQWVVRTRPTAPGSAGAGEAGESTAASTVVAGVAPAAPAAPVPSRAPRSVLVMERDEQVLNEARSALEHAGLRVLTAATPERGLELYRLHQQEVAATVIGTALAESVAGETTRAIREADPGAPIVLLSPDDPHALAARYGELRIAAYLRKPTHPLTLVQTVRDLLAAAGRAVDG